MRKAWRNALKLFALLADEIVVGVFLLIILPGIGVNVPLIPSLGVLGFLIFKDVVAVKFLWEVFDKRVEVGPEALIGAEGVVVEDLDPYGLVKVKNELWSAECFNGRAKKGEKVVVVDVRGTRLIVKTSKRHDGQNYSI